ncbi:MAG: tetratricopeptide repeat protein [Sulfuricaulis sp.]|nr:tetratricopeptide repeat protein [Sulfuricaulis sp.]
MKLKRNDPCPCGSGKKYKMCCGATMTSGATGVEDLKWAVSLLQNGRPGEALTLCTAILRAQPMNIGTLELAGMLHYQSGEYVPARQYFERAVSANPQASHGHANLAQVLVDLHEFETAENCARRALVLDARNADAHNILGNILAARGTWSDALEHYRQAIVSDPQRPLFHHNLGHALQRLDSEDAEKSYRKAMALEPRFAPAYVNLGGLLVKQERYMEARDLLRRAIALDPENADAYNNLGLANRKLGNLAEAFGAYRVALEKNPTMAGIWHNLGLLYEEGNRSTEAMDCFKRAVELDPEFLEAQRDWLHGLLRQGDFDTAHAVATRLLADQRGSGVVLPMVIDVFGRSADFAGRDQAIDQFYRLFRSGHYAPRALTSLLLQLQYPENLDEQENLEYHRLWGEAIEREAGNERYTAWSCRNETEPLRIGYLSPDFRRHSVGYFIQHVISRHDRDRFEVHCYANQRASDEITERIRDSVTSYAEVRDLTDKQLAQRLHDNGIHVLVDLAGHTGETRLDVLALRPAPVQITWLGYPNTTGLSVVDYRLSDPYADGQHSYAGTENLLRLPESFLCFGDFSKRPIRPEPPCRGKGYVTFGSFNNLSKLNAQIVQLWSAILNAVPGSRLLIKAKGADSRCTQSHLKAAFAQYAIAPERITLVGSVKSTEEHLDTYNLVDIALDTFPYHGVTTTCEALWMGVPVVTLVSEAHRSRVGLSLLTNTGLSETIASDEEHYVQVAINLANDPGRLERLRARIPVRLRQSILCDPARFTRQLEAAYVAAWENYRARRA